MLIRTSCPCTIGQTCSPTITTPTLLSKRPKRKASLKCVGCLWPKGQTTWSSKSNEMMTTPWEKDLIAQKKEMVAKNKLKSPMTTTMTTTATLLKEMMTSWPRCKKRQILTKSGKDKICTFLLQETPGNGWHNNWTSPLYIIWEVCLKYRFQRFIFILVVILALGVDYISLCAISFITERYNGMFDKIWIEQQSFGYL